MSGKSKPEMNPEEGQKAIFDLIKGVMGATEKQDLAGLEAIIGKLGDIVDATDIDIPGFAAQQAALQEGTRNARHHTENTQAALWVGDLERADALLLEGPEMDMNVMGITVAENDEYDEDMSEDELQAFLAEAGLEAIDLEDPFIEGPDLYEQIALGTQGAIDEFLRSGADPNLPSGPPQHTALLAALDAPGRKVENIAPLIAAGADAGILHPDGDNALSWAMGYHHLETVTQDSEAALMALLANHGADVNHCPAGHWSVLHRAIIQGGAAQVAALLPLGADITKCLPEGFEPRKLAHATPLMLAASKPEVLRLLLDADADPRIPDAIGRLPVDFIQHQASAARARATDDWTNAHAAALEESLQLVRDHLRQR
ncbi:ankyrin repeat domain-containing protein [Litoreibacter arenae]|uniref:Uncharacterized protein n=1 Tax=Litoreibacter arenae DSM 19593 TaxID=1123360 RepID=S9RP22_9RHOB|nr:ankyrin repeat domain-containing protein [Litoreibacter arenae]EPX79840.1 hypothetical protein thalar_01176 [Litoreibacter arenae DSM 19593]